MLRFTEKEDLEARFAEVEGVVKNWRSRCALVSSELRAEFRASLHLSLIYHDSALEGEVLSHSEIKSAIDPTIISDTSLIPSYDEINRFHEACQFAAQTAATGKKKPLKPEVVRTISGILAPEEKAKGCPYRKDNPLHRLYYHEISPPEKIAYRMRKFGEWLEGPEWQALNSIERAANAHHRLMRIFPWAKRSGKTARILSNLLLLQADYPLAIIHSIDRQRYYEALRGEPEALVSVYLEAIETTAVSEVRVYDEAARAPQKQQRAAGSH